MAIGALIGAYQEDDSGSLRALLPLAGRTLIEYQAKCAAAAGAAPIVVIVERVPQALQDAFERLRLDGVGVFPVSDVNEAVTRFEAGSTILLLGDGIVSSVDLVSTLNGGEFTVFAPVDTAFAKIPAATVNTLKTNDALLTKILTYHVVSGQLDPAAVVGKHATVEKQDLTVTGSGDSLKVNGANVICGGVKTANATVYLIDSVLMPPAA